MNEKYKKIDRSYVLTDSTVNVYGFRLLTAGYQLDEYQKNPIGYYMHRREDGIALKWEDLRIEGDTVVGSPVINLSNARGEQLCNEAENGFLNAASVGHIVVLEYSTDPEMMLPGQTGPTITKWYNKECSLVDIPGNGNALTQLYDAAENELNLADFGGLKNNAMLGMVQPVLQSIATSLELVDVVDEQAIINAICDLKAKTGELKMANSALQEQINGLVATQTKQEIDALLQRALEDRKITIELKTHLAKDYAMNVEGLRALIGAMPAYRSIMDNLKGRQPDKQEAEWQWDDYEKNDNSGKKLKDLRANDPIRYKELFERKFSTNI